MYTEAHKRINAYAGLLAGFIVVLSAVYYIEQISYYLGEYTGIITIMHTYNLNATSSLFSLIAAGSALVLGRYIAYMLLAFAVVVLTVGIVWVVRRQFSKIERTVIAIAAVSLLLLIAILESNFSFGGAISEYYTGYFGAVLGIFSALYPYIWLTKAAPIKRPHAIEINPETPYTNIALLSNRLMKKLEGEISILDQHFDIQGIENLSRLINGNESRYTGFRILANGERFGKEFGRAYLDFKAELAAKKLNIELRVLQENDATMQHERLIMDGSIAYKIPPLNIINRKSEHIVGVNRDEASNRFEELWGRATKYENLK
ncbi:MAG: hypothetical protein QXR58_01410 [Candidatus Micrarchaeaceae archaeon]